MDKEEGSISGKKWGLNIIKTHMRLEKLIKLKLKTKDLFQRFSVVMGGTNKASN